VNHNGDELLARELVEAAVHAGADAVKFQAFDPSKLVTEDAPRADYQTCNLGVGGSQKDMLAPLALSGEQFFRLKRHCDEKGIAFLCTPFDEDNARLVAGLGCQAIKVGSGDLTNHLFLVRLARMGLPMLLSTGMADDREVRAAVEAIRAGCDGILVCSGDVDLQARTLEALVRAVESGAITPARCDDAFLRLRRAKERFLMGERRKPASRAREMRQLLGREEHQLIAAEMAAFL